VAHSAGSQPSGQVQPLALATMARMHLHTEGYRSKSWSEFGTPDAPVMDFVFTVCDNAAGEVCPYWPGQPATAHWGYADPSAVEGGEDKQREAYRQTLHLMRKRLEKSVKDKQESVSQLKSLFGLFTQQRKALEVSIQKTKRLEDENVKLQERNK
jgi:protein-tyrosine-phosphatase